MQKIEMSRFEPVADPFAPEEGFAAGEGALPPAAVVSLMLSSGGDGRIALDPVTRRNRYGTLVAPAGHEISFSSTTASNMSSLGFRAASEELALLTGTPLGSGRPRDISGRAGATATVAERFADLRRRIAANAGCARAEVVLGASGTDIELIALGIALGLTRRPLTNIVIAPDETGSGVGKAAAGFHFADVTALGASVSAGAALDGLAPEGVETRTVAIRDAEARPRHVDEIDAEVIALVELELKRGRDLLVHVLDTSKTGLSGVTRAAARHMVSLAPGRVRVLVDVCQYRCSETVLRQDMEDGFMVAVTGSKFIAGPPFAGALLLPPTLAGELEGAYLPPGLAAYTAEHDWPAALRSSLDFAFAQKANLGLGLRWAAALAHWDGLAETGEATRILARQAIVDRMRKMIDATDGIFVHALDEGAHLGERAILPFTLAHAGASGPVDAISGLPTLSFDEAQAIQQKLRADDFGPICHVGQAVRLNDRAVLRLSASAVDVTAVATEMDAGGTGERALAGIEGRLEQVLTKTARLLRQ